MIHIENLVKRYGDLVALNHLNLDIKEGEIFGLLGPNGSGKTTAINCLLSLLKYDKGEIYIFGQKITPDNYEVKQQIGIVLQNVAVFDELTVSENIDYFCGLYIHDKNRRRKLGRRSHPVRRTGRLPQNTPSEAFRRSSSKAQYCLRDCPQATAYHPR